MKLKWYMHFLKKYWNNFKNYFLRLSLTKRIALLAAVFAGALCSFFLILLFLVWSGMLGPLPGKGELKNIEHQVATEVYSADSVLLGRYFIQERSTVQFDQISPNVISALVATEDARFYKHHGIDFRSMARVLVKSILLGNESSGGGSTITQQLAKNLYPRRDYAFFSMPVNKIREAIIAMRLESIYSKEEILTLYLNTIPFGDNTFGIEAAAQRFFSVDVNALSPEQAAVLVGMLKATYSYNPRVFPKRSRQRRNVVLSQMEKYGYLDEQVSDSLQSLPLTLAYKKITYHTGLAPYFREYIKGELVDWCAAHNNPDGDPYNLYTDGLKIYTTINSKLQEYAEAAMTKKMAGLQKEFNNHWGKREPWQGHTDILQNAVHRSMRYKSLQQQGLSEEAIMKEMKKPIAMTVFSWEGDKDVTMSPLDSVAYYLKFLNAGLLAMDPHTGNVLAWVGGINHHYFQYDHVKESTKRQVGSTFKPIVYAAALENGVAPCEYISAEKVIYTNMEGWSPENGGEENYDLKYSMEGALAYSVNTVSVRVAERAGLANTIDLAKRMGIQSEIPEVPSIALGTPSVSVMEMVTAYSSFVNEGKSVKPFYIKAIADHEGNILESFEHDEDEEQALSKENAQLIVEMLKRVVNEGTGASLRARYGITGDIAGKTGTTQSNADGWFMALMPNLVVGTWVGADDPGIRFRTTSLGQGAHTALPIFATFYKQLSHDKDYGRLTKTKFPRLTEKAQRRLGCALYKSDLTLMEKLFGKKEETEERDFGTKKKKEGFFKRVFGIGK